MIVSGSVPMATTMPIALYNDTTTYGLQHQAEVLALVQVAISGHPDGRQPARSSAAVVALEVRGTCKGSLGLLPPGPDPVRNLAAPRAEVSLLRPSLTGVRRSRQPPRVRRARAGPVRGQGARAGSRRS